MSGRQPEKPAEAIAKLVDSALILSESVVQAVAEAATGQPQAKRPGESTLQTIVRQGTTATSSLLTTVIDAVRSSGDGTTAGPPARRPTIVRGTTLRVPLSIDNPGDDAMEGIVPALVAVTREGDPSAVPLSVAFEPPGLTIGPRDFEKLVVLISAPEDVEPGIWTVAFRLTDAPDPPTTLSVDVA